MDAVDYRGKERAQFQTVNEGPSKTIQSDAHKADINEILAQYEQVGIVTHLNKVDAKYMDVSEFTDFSDAMRQLRMAEQEFKKLPSKVRELFNHDVAEWLDAAHDPMRIAEVQAALDDKVEESKPVEKPEAPAPEPEKPPEA